MSDIDSGEAFAKVIQEMLKRGGNRHTSSFNSPDFCLEDIMFKPNGILQFLRLVGLLAELKGKCVEEVTLGKIPPGAPDGYLGFFNFRVRTMDDFIKKCDGNHAGPACRDAQCWVRGI